jgi:hypothetical protein
MREGEFCRSRWISEQRHVGQCRKGRSLVPPRVIALALGLNGFLVRDFPLLLREIAERARCNREPERHGESDRNHPETLLVLSDEIKRKRCAAPTWLFQG